MSQKDPRSPLPKKKKTEDRSDLNHLCLRISNVFIRTVDDIITPFIPAHSSVTIMRKLKGAKIDGEISKVLEQFGIRVKQFKSGSIVIDAELQKQKSAIRIMNAISKTKSKMQEIMATNIFEIKEVNKENLYSSEPKVQDMDFAIHILDTLKKDLNSIILPPEIEDMMDFQKVEETIFQIIKGKNPSTKVCLLSQNGKGKSFILNLLLLMTADTNEEYLKNNYVTLPLTEECLMGNKEIIPEVFAEKLEKYDDEDDSEKKKASVNKMLKNCNYTSLIPPDKMAEMIKDEKISFSALKRYCEGENLRRFQSYLLPVKEDRNTFMATTKTVVRLHYGRIFQMKIKYMTREDLQNELYELVELERKSDGSDKKDNEEDKHHMALRKKFEILTTHFQEGNIDQEVLMNIGKPSSIQLKKEVDTFAGGTSYFVGLGKNATEDRLFIRENLRGMITLVNVPADQQKLQEMKIAAVKEIVVFAPCKLLCGGKELIEMPGTDESDPLALHDIDKTLRKVNGTLVLSECSFSRAEKDVKIILQESIFLQKFVKSPEDYMFMLLSCQEKNAKYQFRKSDNIVDMPFVKEEQMKRKEEIQCLERLLKNPLPEDVKKNVNMYDIFPVFHSSLLMQDGNTTEVVENFKSNLQHTGVYKVLEKLDQFGFMNLKPKINQVKQDLTGLKNKAELCLKVQETKANQAKETLFVLKNNELKNLSIDNYAREHTKIRNQTEVMLQKTTENFINGKVLELLHKWGCNASEKWKESEVMVKKLNVFNPSYNGRHSKHKVKMYNIAYGKLNELDMSPFVNDIKSVMKQYYKDKTLELLSDTLQFNKNNNTEMEQLIKDAADAELNEAIDCYMGNIRMPFNEKKLTELFEKSLVYCLKENLLNIAYSKQIEDAKTEVTERIAKVVESVAEDFKININELHKLRWKSFCIRVRSKPNSTTPRLLQMIMSLMKPVPGKFKQEKENILQVMNEIDKMIEMVDVALKGTEKTEDK